MEEDKRQKDLIRRERIFTNANTNQGNKSLSFQKNNTSFNKENNLKLPRVNTSQKLIEMKKNTENMLRLTRKWFDGKIKEENYHYSYEKEFRGTFLTSSSKSIINGIVPFHSALYDSYLLRSFLYFCSNSPYFSSKFPFSSINSS